MAQRDAAVSDSAERGIVFGVALAVGGAAFCGASFNFVIRPMTESLGATETQDALLRQIPGMGGLLAIFVAGVLAMRIGARRCLTWSAVLMIVGFLVTAAAPTMAVLTGGLLAAFVGKAAVVVVAVSLLSSSVKGSDARAAAFATLAMVGPAVCVVIPVAASYLVDAVGWRAVAALWVTGGVTVMLVARLVIPDGHQESDQSGELLTPVLAGVVLVGVTQLVRLVPLVGLSTVTVQVVAGGTAAATAVLVMAIRRMPDPSLSVGILRHGGLAMFLVVVLFMPFSNLWFYGTVGAQYVYGLSALAVSLLFIPVQLAGVAGARWSTRLVRARGLTFAGSTALLAAAAMAFLCVFQTTTTPIVIPLAILMVYGASAASATASVTNAFMSIAPSGQEGDASAFRSAAGSLGSSLGAVFLSSIVFTTMTVSMSDQSNGLGMPPQQAQEIADSIREGATSEDVASQYSTPLPTVDQIADDEKQAAVVGYWAQGIAGGTVLALTAGIFVYARRRVQRYPTAPAPDVVTG